MLFNLNKILVNVLWQRQQPGPLPASHLAILQRPHWQLLPPISSSLTAAAPGWRSWGFCASCSPGSLQLVSSSVQKFIDTFHTGMRTPCCSQCDTDLSVTMLLFELLKESVHCFKWFSCPNNCDNSTTLFSRRSRRVSYNQAT